MNERAITLGSPELHAKESVRWIFACFLVGCGGLISQSTDGPDGAPHDGDVVDVGPDGPCAGSCFPRAPEDWTPIAYGAPESCPIGWHATSIVEDVWSDPPICWCSCGKNVDAHCTTSSVSLEVSTDPGCANTQTTNLPHQGCAQTSFDYAPNGPIYLRGKATSTPVLGGSCGATPNLILPTAHATSAVRCDWPIAAGVCPGGGECRAPRNPMVRECVSHDGDAACPDGFPERHLVGDAIADARSCTSCECMFAPAGKCVTYVTMTASDNCTGPNWVLRADGACGKYAYPQLHLGSEKMVTVVEGAACAPKQGASQPIGSVGLWHERTICCR